MKPLGDLYKELISRCEELAADERSGQLMRGVGAMSWSADARSWSDGARSRSADKRS